MKNQKGITLVALVITVIVMLILAGVTINMTLGERGIFNTAASTKEKQEIAEYLEKIELSRVEVASKNMGKVTLDNLIDQIVEDKIVTRERITKIDVDGEEKAKMITKEGYNFIITADKAEYAGKGDVIPTPPTLQEGDIQVTLTPATWTNDKVTVEIKTKVEGNYTIQYSLDEGTTWKDYTTTFDVNENKTIWACLRNALGEKGSYTTYEVDKIDKLPPVQFTPNTSKTTNSITVDASGAKDAEANEKYGKSEIKEIWYSNDDGTTWKINDNKIGTTYTFNNLTQGQTYKIKVKVIDNAGNQTITATKEETTGTVTSGLQEGAITFSVSPTGWTNQDVTVTGATKSGYILQLSTTENFPNNTNEVKSVTVSGNQTVYARLIDSTMQYNGTASYKVDKIDKLAPVQFTPTTTKTTNSITIDASGAKDAEATTTNGKSGIKEIWYSNDDGTTWKINENKTDTTYTFNNLTQGQPYKIKVKVIDNAGNQTITEAKEETTETVTSGLQEGAITFSINPTGWTNQNVTVTGATNTSYTLQLSTSTTFPNNTNEVKSVTVSGNQTVYARLIDSTMQYNGTASYKVDKIDKLAPVQFTPNTSKTTNSITVNASGAKDAEATTTNGKSEIKEIWYSNDDGTTWKINENKISTTYTFNNLTQGQTYKIKVKLVDNAGNQTITGVKEETTGTVTSGVQEGAITFSINPTGWTNQNVTVTGATNTSYTLQLSTSTTFPNNTNEVKSVTVSGNQTVYARLIDSTMQYNGTASYKVDKIDKQKPIVGTLTPTPTSIRITATDEASGIIGYAVTTNTTQPTTFTTVSNTKTLDTTVTGRNQNTTYYVWVKDEAGNVSAYSTTKTTTQAVTKINVAPQTAKIKPNETVQLTASVLPENAFNKTIIWSSENTSIATVSNTGLVTAKAAGSVTITATANDGSGKSGSATITVENNVLASQITAANYGDYVNYEDGLDLNYMTNYGHKTDWRIFYKDDDGYVYLIASHYLLNYLVPSGTDLVTNSRPYTSYWENVWSYTNVAQAIYDRYKMNFKYNGSPYNGCDNMKCVSQLMNTSVWSKFVNTTYAVDAIGAPTLEMWVDSWNTKSTATSAGWTTLKTSIRNSYGYDVNGEYFVDLKLSGGYEDKLYFPVKSDRSDDNDYWLASPSYMNSVSLVCVNHYGNINRENGNNSGWNAVRPLVRLKNTVVAEKGADGVWNLK